MTIVEFQNAVSGVRQIFKQIEMWNKSATLFL